VVISEQKARRPLYCEPHRDHNSPSDRKSSSAPLKSDMRTTMSGGGLK
jgi:hypothetical protein